MGVLSGFDWVTVIRRDIEWQALEAFQDRLVQEVRLKPKRGFLLLSEPHPTVTHGLSAPASDLLWSPETLAQKGVTVAPVSRGGRWTYHGPGQILIYPIVHVESLGFDSRAVVRFLASFRRAISDCLQRGGIVTEGRSQPFGLYKEDQKIASFGVAILEGICRHGVAVYLEDQKDAFAGIHPCGVSQEKITSLRHHGWQANWEDTAYQLAESIKKTLNTR